MVFFVAGVLSVILLFPKKVCIYKMLRFIYIYCIILMVRMLRLLTHTIHASSVIYLSVCVCVCVCVNSNIYIYMCVCVTLSLALSLSL